MYQVPTRLMNCQQVKNVPCHDWIRLIELSCQLTDRCAVYSDGVKNYVHKTVVRLKPGVATELSDVVQQRLMRQMLLSHDVKCHFVLLRVESSN